MKLTEQPVIIFSSVLFVSDSDVHLSHMSWVESLLLCVYPHLLQ